MRKAQGNMPQIGMGIVLILAFIGIMNYMYLCGKYTEQTNRALSHGKYRDDAVADT